MLNTIIKSRSTNALDIAIDWIKAHTVPNEGIIVSHQQRACYPEVTGYFIPTLLSVGETDLAVQYAKWLMSVQQQDGGFLGCDLQTPYLFDTGQVVRGWVALLSRFPELEHPLCKAIDWLISHADPNTGQLHCPSQYQTCSLPNNRGKVDDAIHLYTLAPIRDAGQQLNIDSYVQFVEKSAHYYTQDNDIVRFDQPHMLSHFYAYIQESLFELGYIDLARQGMASVAQYQHETGYVPGYYNVPWICLPGQAQLSKIWYLLGDHQKADRALDFLSHLQNPSGGFFGSSGVAADYMPTAEVSWAVKYFIDAKLRSIQDHFDQNVAIFPADISDQDPRLKAVISGLGNISQKRVLDAGCGKGRYARYLKSQGTW